MSLHPYAVRGDDSPARAYKQAAKVSEMQPPVAATESEMIAQINEAYHACEEATRTALGHAMHCGAILDVVKKRVRHDGRWGRWLEANFCGSQATADLYMRLWRNRELFIDEENSERVKKISLRQAQALISRLRRGEGDEGSEDVPSNEETPKERSKKGGSKKGPKGPGRCDPPAAAIYGATHLPVPDEELAATIREGEALILRIDAPSGGEKALEAAKAHVESVVRAQWAAGYDAHLVVVCGSDISSLEKGCAAVERAVAGEGDEEPSEKSVAQYEKQAVREADKGELTLYQAVMARGGIKPRPSVGEYSEVPLCYLRKDGLAADEIGNELGEYCPQLGVKDEDTLLAAVAARRKKG